MAWDRCWKILNIPTENQIRKLFSALCTFLLCNFAWIFFRVENKEKLIQVLKALFSHSNYTFLIGGGVFQCGLSASAMILLLSCILILFLIDWKSEKISIRKYILMQPLLIRWVIYLLIGYILLFFTCTGAGISSQEFIYMKF